MKTNTKIKIMNPKCFSTENNQWVLVTLHHLIGMKSIWILITSLALSGVLSAQEGSSELASSKENKLNLKEVVFSQQKSSTISNLLESRNFVFEANNLRTSGGRSSRVPSEINFIMVDSSMATIQIGSYNKQGINGLGGVTLKGSITTDFRLIF